MRSHFEYQNRKRQQQPQPEASCHVVKFITRPRGCRSYERLQCHSTDRTASGTTAAYLRVHRTCPHTFRILFSALVVRLFYLIRADFVMIVVMVMGMFTGIFGKITIGMGFKFTLTAGGAEIKLVVPYRMLLCALSGRMAIRTRDLSPYAIRGPRPGIMSAQKQSGCCVALHCHFSQ